MAPDFAEEPRQGQGVEGKECLEGALDLELDLVLEESGVLHHPVVKDKVVARSTPPGLRISCRQTTSITKTKKEGSRREAKVDEEDAEEGDGVERDGLAEDAVPCERRERRVEGRRRELGPRRVEDEVVGGFEDEVHLEPLFGER